MTGHTPEAGERRDEGEIGTNNNGSLAGKDALASAPASPVEDGAGVVVTAPMVSRALQAFEKSWQLPWGAMRDAIEAALQIAPQQPRARERGEAVGAVGASPEHAPSPVEPAQSEKGEAE